MATIKVEKSKGYEKGGGMRSQKSYLAKLTGFDMSGKLQREFPEPSSIDWGDSKLYKRDKGSWTEIHEVEDGVYEACRYGDITCYFVLGGERVEAHPDDAASVLRSIVNGIELSNLIAIKGDDFDLLPLPKTWDDAMDVAEEIDHVAKYNVKDGVMSVTFVDGSSAIYGTPEDAMAAIKAVPAAEET